MLFVNVRAPGSGILLATENGLNQKLKTYLRRSLPGFVTGGADNDPSGIATYSISGAAFGYGQLWLMVIATPMLVAVQATCARIAHVTGKGLATVIRERFSPVVLWAVTAGLVAANVATVGADLLAISFAGELLTGIPSRYFVVPVTAALWYLICYGNYRTLRRLLVLLLPFFLLYFAAALLAHPNFGEIIRGLVWPPSGPLSSGYYVAALAILGTTITPYLLFWQAKEEIEEKPSKASARYQAAHEDLLNVPGYAFSQFVTIAIIIAAAAALRGHGDGIKTAADAALALRPVAGDWAVFLFAAGVAAAGLLAVPVLAISTASVVSEAAGLRRESLSSTPQRARGFYAAITLTLLAGSAMLLAGVDTLKALYYSQVLAGAVMPILLICTIRIGNDRSIMGEFKSGWFDNIFGTLAALVMASLAVLAFVS